MKYILKNPTEEQLAEIKNLGLPVVYTSGTEVHLHSWQIPEPSPAIPLPQPPPINGEPIQIPNEEIIL